MIFTRAFDALFSRFLFRYQFLILNMAIVKKLLIIQSLFEIVGMLQSLSN